VYDLRLMCNGHGNHFGHTRRYSYVMYAKWKLVSVHLEIVLVSAQDMCTVCAECTIGLESILDAPNCTPR
jgi:NAD-dependent dihydropyrimidine dehydrogenase PreA subunit